VLRGFNYNVCLVELHTPELTTLQNILWYYDYKTGVIRGEGTADPRV